MKEGIVSVGFKLKPMAGIFSARDKEKELGSWPITLVPTYNDGHTVWASGQIIGKDKRPVATLNVSGFPIDHWEKAKPRGRPKAIDKHLAVLLAWSLNAALLGGKFSLADDETAKIFGYSEGQKHAVPHNSNDMVCPCDFSC